MCKLVKITFLLVTLLITNAGARNLNDPKTLVGYWRLNGNADDSSGWGNDGTATATVTYNGTTPQGNSAAVYNAADTSINVPDAPQYDFTGPAGSEDAPFSISIWAEVKDVATLGFLMTIRDDTTPGQEWWLYMWTDETLGFQLDEGAGVDAPICTTDDPTPIGWRHIVATYSGIGGSATAASGLRIYIDGKMPAQTQTEDAGYDGLDDTGQHILIGAYDSGPASPALEWSGDIAEVRLYNIELGADEALDLYKRGRPQQSEIEYPMIRPLDQADSTLEFASLRGEGTNDSVGTGFGTLVNNTYVKKGRIAVFDGTNDYINYGTAPGEFGTDDMTFVAWFKPVSAGFQIIYQKGYDQTNEEGYVLMTQDNKTIYANVGTGSAQFTMYNHAYTGNIVIGEWNHAVWAFDRDGNGVVYLNGSVHRTKDMSAFSEDITCGDDLEMGLMENLANDFSGEMQDLRIYKGVAKSPAWAKLDYQKGMPDSIIFQFLNKINCADTNYITIPDKRELSFVDSSGNDTAFSVVFWIDVTATASSQYIIDKYATGAREWYILLAAIEGIEFRLVDESANATVGQEDTVGGELPNGSHWIVCTYNGVGGASAWQGLEVYYDGVQQSLTGRTSGTYVDMEEGAAPLYIGSLAGGTIYNDAIWDVKIYREEKDVTWVTNEWQRIKKYQ